MTRDLTTRMVEGPAPRLVIDRAELRVVAGPDKGLRLELGLNALTIGTDGDCDLVLHDPTVSARHAVAELGPRGYVLRDLDSKNGLRAADLRVHQLPIVDGLKVKLGSTVIVIKAVGGEVDHPLGAARRVGPLVAYSVRMRAVASQLEQLAATEMTVLLEGETGTGKEVAAQALHQASPRAAGPLVVFDCGAQASELVAAELFGHEAGAFTGATSARPGAVAEAEGGVLFLDEIGELPLALQPLLLRLLENRETRRVGGGVETHDVRVIAATNRNLAEEVRAGRFRQDLFYRLGVARVRLPALRERREDIPHLAHMFAEELGAHLTPELMTLFSSHDWPGNVRELRHMVSRAAIASDPSFVAPELDARSVPNLPDARRQAADDFERDYVEKVLAMAGGSVTAAAEIAGVSRQMLNRLIARHGLRRGTP